MYNRLVIEMEPQTMVYLFMIFVGCLIRAMAPFIRKFLAGEVQEWKHYYTFTFIVSYVVAIVATAMVYQQNPLTFTDGTTVALKGLVLGVTSTTIITEVAEWFFPNRS